MTANVIFVLSNGRTGSTLLCQLLTLYQRTKNFNEILSDMDNIEVFDDASEFSEILSGKYTNSSISNVELHRKLRKDPVNLIKEISEYYTGNTIIAKLHLSETHIFNNQEILNWILTQPNHKFVLLERTNFLKTFVSERIALQTNNWHNSNTSYNKITIDGNELFDRMFAYMERYSNIKQKLKDYDIDYLYLEYDRDLKEYTIDNFSSLIDPWSKRIGLNLQLGHEPTITYRRQNINENIFDNITNVTEVQQFIKINNFILNTNYQP